MFINLLNAFINGSLFSILPAVSIKTTSIDYFVAYKIASYAILAASVL